MESKLQGEQLASTMTWQHMLAWLSKHKWTKASKTLSQWCVCVCVYVCLHIQGEHGLKKHRISATVKSDIHKQNTWYYSTLLGWKEMQKLTQIQKYNRKTHKDEQLKTTKEPNFTSFFGMGREASNTSHNPSRAGECVYKNPFKWGGSRTTTAIAPMARVGEKKKHTVTITTPN